MTILLFYCDPGFCRVENEAVGQLSARAMKSFDKCWYRESIELFSSLKEQYPFSSYDAVASLKIADAYFELGQYSDAIDMYEHFEQMYPRNEAVPYVFYRMARAYFNQTNSLSNDQIYIKIALSNYLRLLRQFPESQYSCMARADIDICYSRLSGYEFSIGIFYYKIGTYDSALSRFLKIIYRYPDVGYHRMALLYLSDCESLIQELAVRNDLCIKSITPYMQ